MKFRTLNPQQIVKTFAEFC